MDTSPTNGAALVRCARAVLTALMALPSVPTAADPGWDDCSSAIAVPVPRGSTVTLIGDNSAASGTDCLVNPSDLGWWHAFQIEEPADVTIDFCGTTPTNRPSWAVIFADCTCDNWLLQSYFDRSSCGDFNISMTFLNVTPGTYYLPILTVPGDRRCGNTGSPCTADEECDEGITCTDNLHPYVIHIGAQAPSTPPPANDQCMDAVDITGAAFPVAFDTSTASDDGPPIVHTDVHPGGHGTHSDVWFTYQAPVTCPLTISLCEEPWNFDSMLTAYDGECGSLVELASDDEGCQGCSPDCVGGPPEVTIPAITGEVYTLRVSGYLLSQRGPGVMDIYCQTDQDHDGITANVDPDDTTPSGQFSDSATTGEILEIPEGMILALNDAPNASEGVRMVAVGPGRLKVTACDLTLGSYLELDEGQYVITCGSLGIRCTHGDATVVYQLDTGVTQTFDLVAGGDAEIVTGSEGLQVTVAGNSPESSVTFNGNSLPPGGSVNTTPPAITLFDVSPLMVPVGEQVSCAVEFDDNEDDSHMITYDFGDGATGELSSHSYSNAGTYVVIATVTDSLGSQDTQQQIVQVFEPVSSAALGDGTKNRFVSFVLPVDGAGAQTAIRVELTSLHHPAGPPNAPNFTALEGQYRYLNALLDGASNAVFDCPDSLALGTYKCAKLGCAPEYRDWAGILGGQVVHVTGDSIVPSSQYGVAHLPTVCAGVETTCPAASADLVVTTERWGNVDNTPPGAAPSAIDISKVVDKVKNVPSAFIEPRCLLRDATPNPYGAAVNAQDIGRIVDAVKGQPYPFTVTACP